MGLPEAGCRHLPDTPTHPLHGFTGSLQGDAATAAASGGHHMSVTVIVEHHVQPVTRAGLRTGESRGALKSGGHGRGELPTLQVGDEIVAVVPVETGPAVGADIEADPGAPGLHRPGAERFGHPCHP